MKSRKTPLLSLHVTLALMHDKDCTVAAYPSVNGPGECHEILNENQFSVEGFLEAGDARNLSVHPGIKRALLMVPGHGAAWYYCTERSQIANLFEVKIQYVNRPNVPVRLTSWSSETA